MSEILHYLWRTVPAAILALALYLALRPPRFRRLQGKALATTPGHEVALALFWMFLAGLLWLTVLPEPRWVNGRLSWRQEGLNGFNPRPFLIFKQSRVLARRGNPTYFLINFWGNIAMFLPAGFFPALLWRKGRWWKALLTGVGLSATIELCQLPLNRGTDVDDLWLNTLGALAGYGLARLVAALWPNFAKQCKVQEVSPWT